jgi:hypothetical protein
MTARADHRPLWTCPDCGHRFVTPRLWHSCRRYRLSDHFKGKDPIVRELFNHFRSAVRKIGPVTIYAQKTRIVFQVRSRFAGCMPRVHWLDCGFWLKRRARHHRVRRIETIEGRDYIHYFRLTRPEELDSRLLELLREAYSVGAQDPSGTRRR